MNILKLERSIALLKPIVWKMPMNKKREAYITLLTATQTEANLPLLESSRHIADNLSEKSVVNHE